MNEGKYLCAREDRLLVLKLVGRITYAGSAGFEAFLDRILADGDFNDVVIDLTETTYIDSTNLGLLARVGAFTIERRQRKTTLLSTNPDVNQVLTSMAFDRVFLLVDHPEECVGPFELIPNGPDSEWRMACRMVEAHRTLMQLSAENRIRFQSVVDVLEAGLRKRAEDGRAGTAPRRAPFALTAGGLPGRLTPAAPEVAVQGAPCRRRRSRLLPSEKQRSCFSHRRLAPVAQRIEQRFPKP